VGLSPLIFPNKIRLELEEIADPRFQLDARFEIIITDDDPSFLSSIHPPWQSGKIARTEWASC
jgi:hypothetical protein